MFFLLYKHTDDAVFDDFPKISDHFPKISEDSPKLFWRPDERSRKFPKIPEDVRRFPKIAEDFRGDPKMFRWYTNEFKYNLRDKRDITEIIDIFTCEDIIFTCEDIVSFLSICYHSLYHWLLYNKVVYMMLLTSSRGIMNILWDLNRSDIFVPRPSIMVLWSPRITLMLQKTPRL